MTDHYKRIRAVLGTNLTPGPWMVANTNNGMFIKSLSVPGYLVEVRHCRTTQDHKADAAFIAACDPDTVRELIAERDALLDALRQITEWPDGGNRYGQENIKRFAQHVIDTMLRG